MANTLGYITGALAGLGLTLAAAYTIERPKGAEDILRDTQGSLERTVESVNMENLVTVFSDAGHDIVQRNPGRAWNELGRINTHIDNSPFQDRKLHSAQYRESRDLVDYTNNELQEKWSFSDYLPYGLNTKGELMLGLAGLGVGLATVGALTKRP